ncbi:RND family transporter [Pseudomonas aeruginosa]|jgi:predicted RND superfamily exporter protein|uniref:MMPL family transporter n=1 Tax=Ectopseudomonas toyotomiensis TaxID=554344 RepID=A0AA42ILK8_9GAMM|nr:MULTISPECIES: MMPL family transporter [Pseudomonadaceae]RRU92630.1 RND family transporter [Stutzerimonas xanthomarina]KSE28087.1 RND transporter [Pseudomonas aeruginosa]KSG99986.1 RND transporter [Pseudomonas aeruginosa]KSS49726.1 RND transporter [Pseudomonas aeruginosa]MBA1263104.1 MMPL family transporter [Stutzerimonas stutzeri]
MAFSNPIDMPVIKDPRQFDRASGNWLEKLVFNHRGMVILLCALMTLLLGWSALKLPVNTSFEKMIPQSHPYIQNYFQHRDALRGMGNATRIVVENTKGDIFDKEYLLTLQKVNDAVFLMPGVDQGWMRGLWTSSLRWTEVTEEGYRGGPVIPDRWDGNPESMERLRENINRSGIVGSYVANNMRSSMIFVPMLDINPETGQALDYADFSRQLERNVRSLENDGVRIHIIGFAKLVGNLIDGLYDVMAYFAFSVLIASALVLAYTRCLRSTLLLVFCALLGVVWLLGLLSVLGYELDPYSILVPFLIFAIGLSHGAQKMNGIMQDVGRGTHKYVAARYTFRRLFMAGLTALLVNIVGFAVLMIIDIPVIRDMALTTSLGVAVLIFTKLFLIPVLLSYFGVSAEAARRSVQSAEQIEAGLSPMQKVRAWLIRLTERRRALLAIGVAALLTVVGFSMGRQVQFGDLDAGAPELRPESRYNRDIAFVGENYGLSTDQFVVMLKTPLGKCTEFASLTEADRLSARLREVPGVQTTFSPADGIRLASSGSFEGNPKWLTIPRNDSNRTQSFNMFSTDRPELTDRSCGITPIIAYLTDHKAATLNRVVQEVESYAAEFNSPDREFMLAAGSAGIEATTNIVVKRSFWTLHFVLYGAVALLCFITFRSWRAVVVALVPLIITSILCEALMGMLGIGIKVATLPVIAVGVGVGVDYALYLLSVQLSMQRQGMTLAKSYAASLDFVGRIVALIGLTMAAGVLPWIWSPIKFQADMGILLAFMFLWNMLGALILIPALSHFLLPSSAHGEPALVSSEDERLATLETEESNEGHRARHSRATV